MKKIRQLKAKKGFTMVELIVVIAIIAVLLAMVIPALSSSDRPTAGKGYAKDFFYAVQSYMSRQKLSSDSGSLSTDGLATANIDFNGDGTDDPAIILYAEMTGAPLDTAHCGMAIPGADDPTSCDTITDAKLVKLVEGFMREVDKRVDQPEYGGTLYAVIDDAYRVRATYWSDGDWSETDGQSFIDTCVLASGAYACSYPTTYCTPVDAAGETMFVLS
ncbi:MAG: type II secretion system GspH family protein [Bacteroides sp.]|nr:type II secretion system GspH family protein [Bacteroides sp.]